MSSQHFIFPSAFFSQQGILHPSVLAKAGVAIRAVAKIDANGFFTAFLLVKYH